MENLRELCLFRFENKQEGGGNGPAEFPGDIRPSDTYFTTKKLHRMPAQTADPITPLELQAMACMSK